MPLYRNLNSRNLNTGLVPPLVGEPTRRIARPEAAAKPRSKTSRLKGTSRAPLTGPSAAPAVSSGPIVGWLAVIAGPGRGQVLALHYGVNDIGRSDKSRVRLDFGDSAIMSDSHAAIIYTARSRRFYLQSLTAEVELNGQPAQESLELAGGAILQLAQTRLRFVPLCGADFDWRDDD
ncbi:MAG: FHA domain-containing protein [Candidatus Competibacter denitrificans]